MKHCNGFWFIRITNFIMKHLSWTPEVQQVEFCENWDQFIGFRIKIRDHDHKKTQRLYFQGQWTILNFEGQCNKLNVSQKSSRWPSWLEVSYLQGHNYNPETWNAPRRSINSIGHTWFFQKIDLWLFLSSNWPSRELIIFIKAENWKKSHTTVHPFLRQNPQP